jgi:hypothetical protein
MWSFGIKRTQTPSFLFRATPAPCPKQLCQQSLLLLSPNNIRSGSLSPHWQHHARPRALLDPGSPKATRWHFSEHYLRSPPDRTARQRRHWLPALHFHCGDCRARRQIDHDHQPVASLNTIAPDRPSGSSSATAYVPSKPICAGSELISCTVTSVCLRHDTLGTRHA